MKHTTPTLSATAPRSFSILSGSKSNEARIPWRHPMKWISFSILSGSKSNEAITADAATIDRQLSFSILSGSKSNEASAMTSTSFLLGNSFQYPQRIEEQ